MKRYGKNLNKKRMVAYWLALNDQLEREVLEAPKTVKALKAAIVVLEERVGDERSKLALENAIQSVQGGA